MTAAALLDRCRTAGVDLSAGPGGALAWQADADPPADLLAALRGCKAELLGLLADRAELAAEREAIIWADSLAEALGAWERAEPILPSAATLPDGYTVARLADGTFRVGKRDANGSAVYFVRKRPTPSCSCPGFRFRGNCKHLAMVP